MAKQRNDFGRAWRDKNKCEKSCGHFLLTKRTCKNIQEPTVCRIVLGRLNLKFCPETKKKHTRILFVKKPANNGHKLMNKPWFGAQKDFCTEMLCLPITVDVAILIRQRPVNLWKIARTKLNKLVKKRKNKFDRLNEKKIDIYYGLNMEKNMGRRISLSNDPEICQATFLYSHRL